MFFVSATAGSSIYQGLPDSLVGGRYNSLAITKLPKELEVTARTEDGIIMGIKHKHRPIYGLQFHPESVLTPDGLKIVENFLKVARGKSHDIRSFEDSTELSDNIEKTMKETRKAKLRKVEL